MGQRTQGNVIEHPSETPINSLPLILPPPFLLSGGLWSLNTVPLHIIDLLDVTNAAPGKEERGICHKGQD